MHLMTPKGEREIEMDDRRWLGHVDGPEVVYVQAPRCPTEAEALALLLFLIGPRGEA
jgi:hypothetical protein